MTGYLGLDLSKVSAGWAFWHEGLERPICGTWPLGSALTAPGTVFLRLHQHIHDLQKLGPLTALAYERPLHLGGQPMQSNAESHFLAVGLAAHVESYCEAKGIRPIMSVHQATWRRHFLGKMPRATTSAQLKGMAVRRCRQLGFDVFRHDAAEACGILDYLLDAQRVIPPWVAGEVLRAPLAVAE